MMRRGDKILIVIIIFAAALGYAFRWYNNFRYRNSESIVSIEIDGKVYKSYDLKKTKDEIISLPLKNDEHSEVEFKQGKVRIKYADCPDKICVKTGWISKPGEMIVCIPYRVVIRITGDRQDVDVNTF